MGTALTTISHAWNAFLTPPTRFSPTRTSVSSRDPDRPMLSGGSERSFVSSLYNRIAIDVSDITIKHCRIEDDQYVEDIKSSLNWCLTVSSNKDQIPRDFIQDLVLTMFDQGSAAIVPIDLDTDPTDMPTGSFDVKSMRVGRVIEWEPDYVRVNIYNDRIGNREDVRVPKALAAIVYNPLSMIMNGPNSNLQRLINTLNLADVIDSKLGSGKLDIIMQLPYSLRSSARKKEAEDRIRKLETQLTDSRYGVAYADGTERIVQLNRPVENNLYERVKYLTDQVYGQLGISAAVFNGSAGEPEMNNYYMKTVKPIISAICDSMRRTFLTKTAMSQGQDIRFFRDPFQLMTLSSLADLADKFTRNEIMSSNEFRSVMFLKRRADPSADELRNKNLNKSESGSNDSGTPANDNSQNENNSVSEGPPGGSDDSEE